MKKVLFIIICCFLAIACNQGKELYTTTSEIMQSQGCEKAIDGYKEIIKKYPFSSYAHRATTDLKMCEDKIQRQKEEAHLQLFSGYQNIKFGMDKAQVKKLFDGKLIQNREKYLVYVKDRAEITFWFFHNALEQIDVEPNARKPQRGPRSALEDIQNTLAVLILKYGEYEEKPNMVSVIGGYIEVPIKYYRWGFKDKEVVFTYWDYATKLSFINIEGYQSVKIQYRDLGLKRQKQEAEAAQELQAQTQAVQQKMQELGELI